MEPSLIGRTLSHYKITAKLGAGGMGEVYRAEDLKLKREIALKILPPELAGSQERLARFQREAETVAALDHPNIVTIFSIEETEGIQFLTMQLIEGSTLDQIIPQDGLGLARIFELAIPLADALAAAAEKGITHRDLKPANVMVTPEGRVKVLDFGLAKLLPEETPEDATSLPTKTLTGEGRIMGTVPYMSPEQVEGKHLDSRSDIFSFGIVLYEMATGLLPFQGDTSVSLISSILKDSPTEVDALRDELPRHLGRIIGLCLEKDPERRYQSAKDVRNELVHLDREIEISRSTTQAELRPETPRKSWLTKPVAAGLAVAAVLALAGYAWQSWQRQPAPEPEPAVQEPPARWAQKISSSDARLLFEQGESYRRRGSTRVNLGHAEETWRRALELEPDNLFLKAELAALLAKIQESQPDLDRREEALALADEALADEPLADGTGHPAAWMARAQILRLDGDAEGSEAAARTAIEADPTDGRGYLLLGKALVRQGKRDEGLAEIRHAIDSGTDPIEARYTLGSTLARLGELDEAALELKKVIEYAPDHVSALNNLAVVYFLGGRYLDAVPLFQQVVQLRPDYRSAAVNLGTVYYYLGRYEEAIQAYLQGNSIDPGHPMIEGNLGDAYTKAGDLDAARDWYLKAIASCDRRLADAGSRLDLSTLRALALAKVDRFDEALTEIERLAAENEGDPEVLYKAAQIHALAGQRAGLMSYAERAMRAGYPREEFRRAPEFEQFQSDPSFMELLTSDLESP